VPDHDWYANTPSVIEDLDALSELTRLLESEPRHSDQEVFVAQLSDTIERNPSGAFSFERDGTALLRNAAGRTYRAGRFSTPTLSELWASARNAVSTSSAQASERARLSVLQGWHTLTDIGSLQASAPSGVLFQVASQFNCLEAIGPRVAPVVAYLTDPTQGPRASISALPGTLLRHYRAPRPDGSRFEQSHAEQLNLLSDAIDPSTRIVSGYLQRRRIGDPSALADALEQKFEQIRVGVHDDVDVLFGHAWNGRVIEPDKTIAQVFTSTIAQGAYGSTSQLDVFLRIRQSLLRAAYLGTLLAAIALGKHTAVLTLIGGGVFGNPHTEIWNAILWALDELGPVGSSLHVIVNLHGQPLQDRALADVHARGGVATLLDTDGAQILRP